MAMLAWVGLADKASLHGRRPPLHRPAPPRHRPRAGAVAGLHPARRAGGRHVGRRMRGADGTGRRHPAQLHLRRAADRAQHAGRDGHLATASTCWTAGGRSPRARPPKSSATRRCSPPISAWRRDDRAARRRTTSTSATATGRAARRLAHGRGRRDRLHHRPQRRRQVHHARRHRRRRRARRAATSGSTARASSGSGPSRSPASACRWCRKAATSSAR